MILSRRLSHSHVRKVNIKREGDKTYRSLESANYYFGVSSENAIANGEVAGGRRW